MRPSLELNRLLPELLALARGAGDAILRVYHAPQAPEVVVKSDSSPLTAADLAAHALIDSGLQRLTPEIARVSEEDATAPGDSATQPDVFWLVDPLDGTREFIARRDEFTVNIALIESGRPRLGVVHAPALARSWWGGAGLGAFRADAARTERIAVAPPPRPAQAVRVVASRSHLNDATRRFIARYPRYELVQAGSSLKFCRIAEGAADVYPRLAPTCAWDTAAAQAVVEGAGGHVVQLDGTPLRYCHGRRDNPGFVALSSLTLLGAQGALTPRGTLP